MTAAQQLNAVSVGPTLDFDQVSLTLGRTVILDGVSFQVQPGSIHALVGPNGGGKSSLIKTLLGQTPHQGRLSLEWPTTPGTVGYVPQALEFDRGLPMTVDDFMAAMCQRRPAFLGLSRHYAAAIGDALERRILDIDASFCRQPPRCFAYDLESRLRGEPRTTPGQRRP